MLPSDSRDRQSFRFRDGRTYHAAGRPDYSDTVTGIIRRLTGLTNLVGCALDIGAGTGISTMALAPLAKVVVGVEPSPAMIEHARLAPNVTYRLGSADRLPVDDGDCDLIGVGSALHWFDQERFIEEATRVARPNAWLVIHDHWFMGQMKTDDRFSDWVRNVYMDRYPPPPRDRTWQPPDDLGSWLHVSWKQYEQRFQFDEDRLARYLLTQSNLQTVIHRGEATLEGLRSWLKSETGRSLSDGQERTFLFGGFVACHRQA